ncbi:MAG: ribosome maturation factor RimP [Defluviitaleaceae bacterium]|nr:ribosome maturation factor RimP [Defluviitaleaceae bacterium]
MLNPKSPILATVQQLLEPIIEAQHVELYDLELLTEHGRKVLRLYIEKDGGITLDDCERITYAVEPVLDANDPIPGAYVLEVSSPGIERKLVKDIHYTKHIGQLVEVKLDKPIDVLNNQKKIQGTLVRLEENAVIISIDALAGDTTDTELKLPREHLIYCRLVYMV